MRSTCSPALAVTTSGLPSLSRSPTAAHDPALGMLAILVPSARVMVLPETMSSLPSPSKSLVTT